MTRTLEEIWPPYGLVVEAGDLRMTALREAAGRRTVPVLGITGRGMLVWALIVAVVSFV